MTPVETIHSVASAQWKHLHLYNSFSHTSMTKPVNCNSWMANTWLCHFIIPLSLQAQMAPVLPKPDITLAALLSGSFLTHKLSRMDKESCPFVQPCFFFLKTSYFYRSWIKMVFPRRKLSLLITIINVRNGAKVALTALLIRRFSFLLSAFCFVETASFKRSSLFLHCSAWICRFCCHVCHQLRAALAIMGCKSFKNISAIQSWSIARSPCVSLCKSPSPSP